MTDEELADLYSYVDSKCRRTTRDEDLQLEISCDVWDRLAREKPDKLTDAKRLIKNETVNSYKRRRRSGINPLGTALSLNAPTVNEEGEEVEFVDLLESHYGFLDVYVDFTINEVLIGLPDLHRRIYELKRAYKSNAQVAEELGISQRHVRRILKMHENDNGQDVHRELECIKKFGA